MSANDVRAAASRLAGRVARTPYAAHPALDAAAGAPVVVKLENRQATGAFKLRGALNWMSAAGERGRAGDVAAFSAGNHAAALAEAARADGRRAHILMPRQAPAVKVARARSAGAEISFYDRERDDREALLAELAARTGAHVVHAFEDPWVIAGGGTAGLELMQDAGPLDLLVIPCGGGGLAAGCGLVGREINPALRIAVVEPEGHDDMGRSLRAGRRLPSPVEAASLCDALLTPAPGARTFALLQALGAEAATVTEAQVKHAVRFAWRTWGEQLEPGGAAALAAVLAGRVEARGGRVGVLATGGNIDPAMFKAIVEEAPAC